MNDRDWEILRILYDKRNITQAAKTLYISQPALTFRLQQIAAAAPKSSHYVGEAADGFITTSGKPSTLYTDTLIPAVTIPLALRRFSRSAG